MLELEFDAATLHTMREAVLAHAIAAGMPEDRALDVMLAVHELAANAIRHGGGAGLLQVRATGSALHCFVSDAGRDRGGGGAGGGDAPGGDAGGGGGGAARAEWLVKEGHGLHLVREVADEFSVASGGDGSRVTAVFAWPSLAGPRPDANQGLPDADGGLLP